MQRLSREEKYAIGKRVANERQGLNLKQYNKYCTELNRELYEIYGRTVGTATLTRWAKIVDQWPRKKDHIDYGIDILEKLIKAVEYKHFRLSEMQHLLRINLHPATLLVINEKPHTSTIDALRGLAAIYESLLLSYTGNKPEWDAALRKVLHNLYNLLVIAIDEYKACSPALEYVEKKRMPNVQEVLEDFRTMITKQKTSTSSTATEAGQMH